MKYLFPAFVALLSFGVGASAQTSAFTYQGRLSNADIPAAGNFDMRFSLHDTPALPNQVGSAVTIAPVSVSNGLFTVTMNFGAGVFDGSERWLQIAVRSFGDTNAYSVLSPRQQITSSPYATRAINAANAANATVALALSAPLPLTNVSGIISDARLSTNVAFLNSNAFFKGSVSATQFNGSGAGLTGVPSASLTGTIPNALLPTNVALLNTNVSFLGTVSATNFNGNGSGLTNVPGRLFDNIPIGSATQALPNTGYLATNDTAAVVVTLPAGMRVGETVRVAGSGAGGWIIAQHNGQSILVANLLDSIGLSWKTNGPALSWESVASSVDGSKLVAVASGGRDYTSINFGTTWLPQDVVNRNWTCVASSGDGTKLVGGVTGGQILTSTDSGGSWTGHNPSANWAGVASSLDGTRLVGVISGGSIYTSATSGTGTWTQINTNLNWTGVASSANGSNLVAVAAGARIHTSANAGASWTSRATIQGWSSVASSHDGSRLIAAANPGQIYISADAGLTWAPTGPSDMSSVSSSADGTRLVAAGNPGSIYVSLDAGITWFQAASTPSNLGWTGVAFSGDGSSAVAVALGNPIYASSQSTTTPGTAGYLSGTRQSAIDLIYIGNNQFMPVTHIGTIRAH